ncbi:cytochrome P450 [Auriculariales sp. MPI-PUGE-AT-0066]|nr:cytochrome P450 [Auriculariales sp. MPI-PUGE-AT-0066]
MDAVVSRLLQPDVAVGAVVVVTSAVVGQVLWNLKFSPLARQNIPGPWYTAISDFWYGWQGVRFRRVMAIDDLFKEYGPVVRIGPNSVAFLDSQVIHEIYRTYAHNKGAFFENGTFGGKPNSIMTTDSAVHARFRRWHIGAFRKDRMRLTANALVEQMDDLVERLTDDCAGGNPVDVLLLSQIHALDVLGISILNTKFQQIRKREEHPAIKYHIDWLFDLAMRVALSGPLYNIMKALPVKRLREIFSADAGMCAFAGQLYDETPDVPPAEKDEMMSIVAAGKWHRDPVTGEATPKAEVSSEMGCFVLAGIDTASVSQTFALYELARQPKIYENVRAELRAASKHGNVYDGDLLRSLPYLNALVKEVLRANGPASLFLERVIPAGRPVALAGYQIPAGTTVGCTPRSTALREDLFPDPELVNPERWVEMKDGAWATRNDATIADMNAAWWPFGLGVRACVGRPLAELQMLMTTAALVSAFRIDLHKSTTPDSMSAMEIVVIQPKAQQCLLHFTHTL